MTTPSLEERMTILETRFDTILPTLATKADIAEVKTDMARMEGEMKAMNERLNGKMDAMGNRLLIRFAVVMVGVAAVAVAAAKYL